MRRTGSFILYSLLFVMVWLSCRDINAPELGDLRIDMTWPASETMKTLNTSGVAGSPLPVTAPAGNGASVAEVRVEIEPGGIRQSFSGIRDTYELSLELGFYDISVRGFSADSTLLFSGDTTRVLVQPGALTTITLTLWPLFPWIAPEFRGLADPQANNSGTYTLSWTSVEKADAYRLEESGDPAFTASAVLYTGADTTFEVSGKQDGDYYYRVRAENSVSTSPWSRTAHVAVSVSQDLEFVTLSLPAAHLNEFYETRILFSGGVPPYVCEPAGLLPEGLEMTQPQGTDASVLLSGTPGRTGHYPFTMIVYDSSVPVKTAEMDYSITVLPDSLRLHPIALPEGTVSTIYQATLTSSGGSGDISWSITQGSLPPGLFWLISAIGADITGTPTETGTFPFRVKVQDTLFPQLADSSDFVITINPAPLTITTTVLAGGRVGVFYSQTLAATGGTTPYAWSVPSGSLPSGLSLNTSSGTISGSPASAGTFNFTVRVDDGDGLYDTQSLSVTITSDALIITTPSPLPEATAGQPYSKTLSASGGTPPYTWTELSRTPEWLAEGLTLSAAGVLSGDPGTDPDAGQIQVRVTDSGSPAQSAVKTFDLTVNPGALAKYMEYLPDADVGSSYWGFITYRYGTAPLVAPWTLTGSLPPGVSVEGYDADNYQMNLSGTPTTAGTYNFQVTIYDSDTPPQSRTDSYSITIISTAFTITTSSLSAGKINQAYSGSIATENGTQPLSYSIAAGSIPPGLSITPSGSSYLISGTPTSSGEYTFTFEATDSSFPQKSDSKSFTLKIHIRITTTSLPDGQQGTVYNATLFAEGGSSAYDWSVSGGSLPPGTSLLASSSFADVTGIPTATGTYTFTILAVDQLNPALSDSRSFSITINSP
ncbi:putative Ig domain-containing protein [bacterium]|nr:putative Ig domain-containing protein [bacterium]